MPIDMFHETVISLTQATKLLPERSRSGKKPHVSTLYRWSLAGLRNQSGARIRLETIKVGGTTCTSQEALQRFFERLSSQVPIVEVPRLTSRQRLRQIQLVEKELEEAGL